MYIGAFVEFEHTSAGTGRIQTRAGEISRMLVFPHRGIVYAFFVLKCYRGTTLEANYHIVSFHGESYDIFVDVRKLTYILHCVSHHTHDLLKCLIRVKRIWS